MKYILFFILFMLSSASLFAAPPGLFNLINNNSVTGDSNGLILNFAGKEVKVQPGSTCSVTFHVPTGKSEAAVGKQAVEHREVISNHIPVLVRLVERMLAGCYDPSSEYAIEFLQNVTSVACIDVGMSDSELAEHVESFCRDPRGSHNDGQIIRKDRQFLLSMLCACHLLGRTEYKISHDLNFKDVAISQTKGRASKSAAQPLLSRDFLKSITNREDARIIYALLLLNDFIMPHFPVSEWGALPFEMKIPQSKSYEEAGKLLRADGLPLSMFIYAEMLAKKKLRVSWGGDALSEQDLLNEAIETYIASGLVEGQKRVAQLQREIKVLGETEEGDVETGAVSNKKTMKEAERERVEKPIDTSTCSAEEKFPLAVDANLYGSETAIAKASHEITAPKKRERATEERKKETSEGKKNKSMIAAASRHKENNDRLTSPLIFMMDSRIQFDALDKTALNRFNSLIDAIREDSNLGNPHPRKGRIQRDMNATRGGRELLLTRDMSSEKRLFYSILNQRIYIWGMDSHDAPQEKLKNRGLFVCGE